MRKCKKRFKQGQKPTRCEIKRPLCVQVSILYKCSVYFISTSYLCQIDVITIP